MGGKTPETCWAVNKRQDNRLENCCIWLVIYLNCTMMHELTNLKFTLFTFCKHINTCILTLLLRICDISSHLYTSLCEYFSDGSRKKPKHVECLQYVCISPFLIALLLLLYTRTWQFDILPSSEQLSYRNVTTEKRQNIGGPCQRLCITNRWKSMIMWSVLQTPTNVQKCSMKQETMFQNRKYRIW